jgi:hypothetical protein
MTTLLFADLKKDKSSFEQDDFVNAKAVVIEHLFKHKVLQAEVKFTGENGKGSADEVILYFRDGTMIRIDGWAEYRHIEDGLCTPVYAEVDFPSIEYITGKVTWIIDSKDAKNSKIKIESSERIETYKEVNKEL